MSKEIRLGTKLYKFSVDLSLVEYTFLGKEGNKYKLDNGEGETVLLGRSSVNNLCMSRIIILTELEEVLREKINSVHQQMRLHKLNFNPLDTVTTVYVGKRNVPNEIKAVHQYDRNSGRYIASYRSAKEASREVGGNENFNHIGQACKGVRKTCHGYMWSYEKVDFMPVTKRFDHILEYELDGTFVKKHKNISDACRSCDGHISNLTKVFKDGRSIYKGKIWKRGNNISEGAKQ